MEENKEYTYYAFISYKREEERWAKWLQRKLEHYRFPTNLNGRGDLPKRIYPTFRDVTDLNPGQLAVEIDKNLQDSEWLIVMCSPRSAQSPWVCKEAQTFIDLGRADHIIPFIIDGTPFSDDIATECYPEALRNLTGKQELLAANINEMGREAAAIKVIARMFNLRFDTLWQRHERELQKRRNWIIVIVASVIIFLSSLTGYILYRNHLLLLSTSRAAAGTAEILIEKGDFFEARRVALAALERAYTLEAEIALRHAFSKNDVRLKTINGKWDNAVFSLDGNTLASISNSGIFYLWDANSCQLIDTINFFDFYRGTATIAFSPDGKTIAINLRSQTNSCSVYDINSGTYVHFGDITATAFSSDGTKIILADDMQEQIYIWDIVAHKYIDSLNFVDGECESIIYKPDGTIVAAFYQYDKDIISIRNISTNHQLCVLRGTSPLISPDGIYCISTLGDSICIWDINTGKCIHKLIGHTSYVKSITITHDGKKIISTSNDKTVCIWSVNTGMCLKKYSIDAEYAMLCPNNNKLAITQNKAIIFKSIEDNNEKTVKEIRRIGIRFACFVSFSPDGEKIYAYSGDTIRIIDASTNKFIDSLRYDSIKYPLRGQTGSFFSQDGKKNASSSDDGTIRIRNIYTGRCQQMIKVSGKVYDIAYSPDGKKIVSISSDEMFRIWDVNTGKCIFEYEIDDDRPDCLHIIYSPKGDKIVLWSSLYSDEITIINYPDLKELINKAREQFKDYPFSSEERKKYYLD